MAYHSEPNWHKTTVAVEDLKAWLKSRRVTADFFFAPNDVIPPFLDSTQEKYAPKLAAAFEAWQAVTTDPSLSRNRTPKGALTYWLNRNAARFGLVKDDGLPNKLAIQEAAKVANWDTKGGAPKTPVEPTHPK